MKKLIPYLLTIAATIWLTWLAIDTCDWCGHKVWFWNLSTDILTGQQYCSEVCEHQDETIAAYYVPKEAQRVSITYTLKGQTYIDGVCVDSLEAEEY